MAQRVVSIGGRESCSACRIALRRQAVLAPPSERARFATFPRPSVGRDGEGRFVVAPVIGDSVVAVFRSSGEFEHMFGRVGQGPGEFTSPTSPMIVRVSRTGGVYVFDLTIVHQLSAGATRTVAVRRHNVLAFDAVVVDETAVVQAFVASRGGGTVLQVLSDQGTVLRGIGETGEASDQFDRYRKLARARGKAAVWAARINRYEADRISLDGVPTTRVVRKAEWFPEYDSFLEGELFLTPQRPRIEGLLETDGGLFWVIVSHGAQGFHPLSGQGERAIDRYLDLNALLDSTVEVIDLETQRVVARRRFDSYLSFVSTPDDSVLLYSLRSLESGEIVIEVFSGVIEGR